MPQDKLPGRVDLHLANKIEIPISAQARHTCIVLLCTSAILLSNPVGLFWSISIKTYWWTCASYICGPVHIGYFVAKPRKYILVILNWVEGIDP